MTRTQWTNKGEVIGSLALKTDRGDKALIALVESFGLEEEYAMTFENALDARGEHALARALIDGGSL